MTAGTPLGEVFQFTPEQLTANRQGELAPDQLAALRGSVLYGGGFVAFLAVGAVLASLRLPDRLTRIALPCVGIGIAALTRGDLGRAALSRVLALVQRAAPQHRGCVLAVIHRAPRVLDVRAASTCSGATPLATATPPRA